LQIGTAEGGFARPIQVNTDPFDAVPYDAGSTNYPIQPLAFNSVVALPDGGLAVIWHENLYQGGATIWHQTFHGWDTKVRYFNADGTARTDEITIAHRPAEYGNLSLHVRAEALPDGRIAFAYNTGVYGVNGNGAQTLWLGTLAANGGVSEVHQISPTAANTDFFTLHDLAVRADGTVEVAYFDDRPNTVDGVFQPGRQQVVVERFAFDGLGYAAQGGGTGNDTLTGTSGADLIIANAGDDAVNGGAGPTVCTGAGGNDTLDGGAQADLMEGGSGDDTYVVDSVADRVVERANNGLDRLYASVSYTLPDNVERIYLTGTAQRATGNALDNWLTGNDSANVLDGLGGADRMAGGRATTAIRGFRRGSGDRGGRRRAGSRVRLGRLHAPGEHRAAVSHRDSGQGTGNGLNNWLTGNASDNVLDGKGGADLMAGGLGDDRYYVDSAGDQVVEGVNAGLDRVFASIDYTLPANTERLTLSGAAVRGVGNELDNWLTGTSLANTLEGLGGADLLRGGGGADTFVFSRLSGSRLGGRLRRRRHAGDAGRARSD
jgi:Ca2+-binding RTX toxin-like protein